MAEEGESSPALAAVIKAEAGCTGGLQTGTKRDGSQCCTHDAEHHMTNKNMHSCLVAYMS